MPFEVLWQHSKLLIETFREIRGRAKAYNESNLIDAVLLLTQEFCCLFQANQTDEVVGSQFGDALYFAVKSGTAHIEHDGQGIYIEVYLVKAGMNGFHQFIKKVFVCFGMSYDIYGRFG